MRAQLRGDVESHLLVRDQGRGEIANAMQLIAGCVHGELGIKAQYREIVTDGQAHVLREPPAVYAAHGDGECSTYDCEAEP